MKQAVLSEELINKALEIFKDLIRINTSNPPGNESEAVKYLQSVLEGYGIESICTEGHKDRGNLIAKLPGGTDIPLVMLSHLDVVGADESKWSIPPFEAVEKDGSIWGRGTLDTKHLTVMELMAFILLKQEAEQLNRDVYLVATADEENGSRMGMGYVVEHFPELQRKSIVLNEGGGFPVKVGGNDYLLCASGEKGSCRMKLKARGSSGHASCPPEDQAVVKLAKAIEKIAKYSFPPKTVHVFDRFLDISGLMEDDTVKDETLKNLMEYMLYSSVTINDLDVGERINVIPGKAETEIEIKFLPGTSREEIEDTFCGLLAGTGIELEIVTFEEGYESGTDTDFFKLLEENARRFGFDGELLPFIALGRTDGRFMGPSGSDIYGCSPVLPKDPFYKVLGKVHNNDECISVDSMIFGIRVICQTVYELCLK